MKVLVVVDMQNDFLTGVLGNKETASVITPVVEKIKGFEGVIVVTQDTHPENYLETQEGKNLPVVHCVKDTEGWDVNPDVVNALESKDYFTVEKETFGSNMLPIVYRAIEDEGNCVITEIELVGVCTDICVISNALLTKAFLPEVPLTVDASCCAGVTPETHKNALEAMKMCQIKVINE